MKKNKMIITLSVFIIFTVLITSNIFAFEGLKSELPADNSGIGKIDEMANKTWGTISRILRIAAFAGIIFTGVRYMFASADSRADMKKSTITLIIGMLIVFGTTTIIDIIIRIVKNVT